MVNPGRKEQCLILIVVAVVLFTAGYRFAGAEKTPVELVGPSSAEATREETGPVVHVDGAVEKPGVYELPPNSRVNDAIEKAVALPEADLSALNLAALLKDGQKLVVARRVEQPLVDTTNNTSVPVQSTPSKVVPKPIQAVQPNGLVNINTASATELDSLPGIGPALAQRIIQHREANGPFATIEDLKNVSGIGDKKFADLEHKVSVQ